MTLEQELEFLTQGTVDVLPKGELFEKLKKSKKSGIPLKVKLGVDPTGSHIHLGHTVALQRMKAFQDLGHTVVFLIGDYTGMIGDPSGRSATRPMLSHEELLKNSESYKNQVLKVLDPEKTEFAFNSHWLSTLTFSDIMKITSQITVAQMLEREDFNNRYQEGSPISLVEFMYPLMQGYDSVAMKCDVEIGGQDQIFNLLMGRHLQKFFEQEPQVVMTVPLLEGTDGVKKMSKSYDNTISINDTPIDIFGKTMSISDDLMWKYLELLTHTSLKEIKQLKESVLEGHNPRDIKLHLAQTLVETYYSPEVAQNSKQEFLDVFSKRSEIPTDTKEITIISPVLVIDILVENHLVESKSEARRLIEQGAVSFNAEKITDMSASFSEKEEGILKVGKRRFLKIK